MIAKRKNLSNLIKIICVLVGAVFAFSLSVVYGAFSWQRTHNSGYATGTYLPNQSYQIINDTLPNGIPFGDGVKEYEIALQYSYDYNFKFYVDYTLKWSNNKDTSNVILNYSNRDAWIVDNSRMYYCHTVAAGTGKLPIIVGVDFVNCYDETYFGAALKIEVTVKIVKENESLEQSGTAGAAYGEYLSRMTTNTISNAYVMVYNQTDIGSYKPKAPVGKTAYKVGNSSVITEDTNGATNTSSATTKKIFGNKNYVGLGVYVITGNSPINLKAKVIGNWQKDDASSGSTAGDVHVNSNTIKYDYSAGWSDNSETYDNYVDSDGNHVRGVQEIRTYQYQIPAHTAIYIEVVDSVELITRGFFANANYTDFHIETQLNLNEQGNIATTNGIGTTTITTIDATTSTNWPDRSISVYNRSKFDAALYTTGSGQETYKTQVKIVNNTANKLSFTASYKLKIYVSNGNSAAEYGEIYNFNDATHWDRDILDSTALTVNSKNANQIIAPYSAITICTSFSVNNGITDLLVGDYVGLDVWAVLEPTITPSTSAAADSTLALETEVSGTTVKLYAKNLSGNKVSGVNLTLGYSHYNNQANMTPANLTSKPDTWDRDYWKYYILEDGKYVQVTELQNSTITTGGVPVFNASVTYYTFAGWQSQTQTTTTYDKQVMPGEKVLLGTLTVTAAQIYDFSNYTLTGTVTDKADVEMVNESTGLAYLINNSTTKSYYVAFNKVAGDSHFFNNGSSSVFYGLIRPGQVVKVTFSPVPTQGNGNYTTSEELTLTIVEDTTGYLTTTDNSVINSLLNRMKECYG